MVFPGCPFPWVAFVSMAGWDYPAGLRLGHLAQLAWLAESAAPFLPACLAGPVGSLRISQGFNRARRSPGHRRPGLSSTLARGAVVPAWFGDMAQILDSQTERIDPGLTRITVGSGSPSHASNFPALIKRTISKKVCLADGRTGRIQDVSSCKFGQNPCPLKQNKIHDMLRRFRFPKVRSAPEPRQSKAAWGCSPRQRAAVPHPAYNLDRPPGYHARRPSWSRR